MALAAGLRMNWVSNVGNICAALPGAPSDFNLIYSLDFAVLPTTTRIPLPNSPLPNTHTQDLRTKYPFKGNLVTNMTLLQLAYINNSQGCLNKNINNTSLYLQESLGLVKNVIWSLYIKLPSISAHHGGSRFLGKNASSQAPLVFALLCLSIPRTNSLFWGLTLVFCFLLI